MDNLKNVNNYITNNMNELLADWFDLIRKKSVSATGEGIVECCDWIIDKMQKIGIRTFKHDDVKPHPLIEGRLGTDPNKKTVLIYAHYDVKPAGNLEEWKTPPFEPIVKEGVVFARGSADNKSPLMAHLEAVDFYLKCCGELPVNLICLFEGCEEDGSKGLPEFLKKNKDKFKADLVFFSDGPKDPSGLPIIALGAKGILGIKIKVRTLCKDVHSRYAPVLPSATWRIVQLLNDLKQGNKVLVPGFYDDITEPKAKELEILKRLPSAKEKLEEMYGVKIDIPNNDFYYILNNTPTFNISRIESGSYGVVPSTAYANIDIRLVAGQKPIVIFEKIKKYINELGYNDVELEYLDGVEPSKTDIETPFLPVIEEATKDIYGDYVIYPCRPSTAPDFLWTNILRLPAIQVRWSDPDSDNHAPNEHLSIKEYLNGIALTAHVLKKIADMK